MAFMRDLVSILMVCISYQAVVAYPRNGDGGLIEQQDRSIQDLGNTSALVGSFSKLSTSCRLAASSLLVGEFGTCAKLMELASILEYKGSVVPPINTWISGACTSSVCDAAVLAAASETITTGCQTDLDEQSIAAATLYSAVKHYDLTRGMVCTQNNLDGSFCLASVLRSVEARIIEKITVAVLNSLLSGELTQGNQVLLSVPKEAYCTDCAHAIVSQSAAWIDVAHKDPGIKTDFRSNGTLMNHITNLCGASFGDGKLPATVKIVTPN